LNVYDSCLKAQTSAMTHPIKDQPKNRFKINIAVKFFCFQTLAIIDGRK